MCNLSEGIYKRGKAEGRSQGLAEGRLTTLCNAVKNVMKAFHVSMEDAMNGLEVPQEERALLVKML